MLYQKVRPQKLTDICGNPATIDSISTMLSKDPEDRPHSFLLKGPSGCGKTTLARIIATELGCTEMGIEELNAANTRGIDTIRMITQNATLKPLSGKAKAYILDESHQLTSAAQQALLKVIEDVPKHCYFFFCTTEPQNLIKTIKNRCAEYSVESLGRNDIILILKRALCTLPDVDVEDEVLKEIAKVSEGSPRAALMLLEQVMYVEDVDTIVDILLKGTVEDANVWDLVNLLCSSPNNRLKKWKRALELCEALDSDAEQIRRTILSCTLSKLKACKEIEEARDYCTLLQVFSQSVYYGGKAQLDALVVQACIG
jgi:DNA polymerase III gamma/tau subunit